MSKAHPPELKKFMDKKIHLRINGSRQVFCKKVYIFPGIKFSPFYYSKVEGTLCGFDPFMNLVLDNAIEITKEGRHNTIGMSTNIIFYLLVNELYLFRNDRG